MSEACWAREHSTVEGALRLCPDLTDDLLYRTQIPLISSLPFSLVPLQLTASSTLAFNSV